MHGPGPSIRAACTPELIHYLIHYFPLVTMGVYCHLCFNAHMRLVPCWCLPSFPPLPRQWTIPSNNTVRQNSACARPPSSMPRQNRERSAHAPPSSMDNAVQTPPPRRIRLYPSMRQCASMHPVIRVNDRHASSPNRDPSSGPYHPPPCVALRSPMRDCADRPAHMTQSQTLTTTSTNS